jgi:uncharacterized membrane protein YbaN (DUF454 family)
MSDLSMRDQHTEKDSKQPKGWFFLALGWVLVALGIAGLFLPLLQGVLFIGLGVGLLMRESSRLRRWAKEIRNRYQRLRGREKGETYEQDESRHSDGQ